MCSLIVDLGALAAVESRIEEHTHRALEQLSGADIADDARVALSDLVRLVSNRSA
ncbi:Probable polyprenyl synthetase [Mycobacteroides abscessus subsp. massiliense]|nr:Probable polyprenyl synthetase [Mycobacteroides abscessus subsp. massiliense]